MQPLRTRFKFSTRLFALVGTLFISMMLGNAAQAQTTIVNYDFNAATAYPAAPTETAPGVTSSATSTEPFLTFSGTATGAQAFTPNATGPAIAMQNSSGTNTKYFQFNLGGEALSDYASYKIYFQAQRSNSGAQVITLAYSTNGGTSFTNFPTTGAPGNGSFSQILFDLTSVMALNNKDNIIFRLLASGASGTGTLRIDNFQVQAVNSPLPTPQLIISEFRLQGRSGACDEFVEIYNASDAPYVVQSTDGAATGFAVVSSNGPTVLFTIPNGDTIPARGHYLGTNNGSSCTDGGAYSSGTYPAGNGTTATGDRNFVSGDTPLNAGIALFNTSSATGFTTDNRLDAVGPTTEANTLFKEGTGYPQLHVFAQENFHPNYSIYRDLRSGLPKDTNDNDADFDSVDTNGTELCDSTTNFACRRLGAPGPENTSSPIQRNANIKASLIDPQCTGMAVNPVLPSACRFERRTEMGGSPTSFGTLSIRRRFTNSTGATVTRLRFRIVDITNFPEGELGNGSGRADLRAISSSTVTAFCQSESGIFHQCSDNPGPTTEIVGTTLETDEHGQENGGGFNSTLTLPNQLADGAGINLQFTLGVEANGFFRFFVNVEALTSDATPPAATKAQATGKARASKLKK
ncbi:MAG TPA: lamin tail domain-containing protein [Pyrinomonadaceae bacterium]|nr:lamin tail domain-containing protein [Pyrinomonadaceae bacterium]